MSTLLGILITTLFLLPVFSQHSIYNAVIDSRSRGMSMTGVCGWEAHSILMNPGLAASIKQSSIHFEVHNYYLVKGLYSVLVHGTYTKKQGSGIGLHILADGSDEYRNWLAGISYGRKLGKHTEAGLSFNFIYIQTPESKDPTTISFDLGLQTRLSEEVLAGFVIKNAVPVSNTLLQQNASYFKTGINYRVHQQLQVLLEFHKAGKAEGTLHCGMYYSPSIRTNIYAGWSTSSMLLSFGFCFRINEYIKLTSALSIHTELGNSSSFGFAYLYPESK